MRLITVCTVALLAAIAAAGCGERGGRETAAVGDAEQGRLLLRQFGCGSCHRIPGVATADGLVGPPLDGVGRRVYLAGFVPNTPANMAAWIRDPQAIAPGSAMPDMQVGESDSRDMTAYLQQLR